MDSEFIKHLDAQRHPRPHPQCCTGNCEQGRTCTAPRRRINWPAIIVYGSCAAMWVATAWAVVEILK